MEISNAPFLPLGPLAQVASRVRPPAALPSRGAARRAPRSTPEFAPVPLPGEPGGPGAADGGRGWGRFSQNATPRQRTVAATPPSSLAALAAASVLLTAWINSGLSETPSGRTGPLPPWGRRREDAEAPPRLEVELGSREGKSVPVKRRARETRCLGREGDNLPHSQLAAVNTSRPTRRRTTRRRTL